MGKIPAYGQRRRKLIRTTKTSSNSQISRNKRDEFYLKRRESKSEAQRAIQKYKKTPTAQNMLALIEAEKHRVEIEIEYLKKRGPNKNHDFDYSGRVCAFKKKEKTLAKIKTDVENLIKLLKRKDISFEVKEEKRRNITKEINAYFEEIKKIAEKTRINISLGKNS